MKYLRQVVVFAMLLSFANCLHAQSDNLKPLFHAATLRDAGNFSEEITYLLPFVRPESHQLDEAERGVALNILGLAYQDVGDYDSARRFYDDAVAVLKRIPDGGELYAAALDNYGSLTFSLGDLPSSIAFRQQALKIYQQVGDHAGAARTLGNLARVAIARNDERALRNDLKEAFAEAKLADRFSDSDMASLLADQASLLSFEHNDAGALVSLNQAIALWIRSHGPEFFVLGSAYSLRAQAYDRLGDTQKAALDMQHALTIIAKTSGAGTPRYQTTQLIYAGILRHAGDLQQATALEREARQPLVVARQHPCDGCTLSAASVR